MDGINIGENCSVYLRDTLSFHMNGRFHDKFNLV